jgi:hypothetical protein
MASLSAAASVALALVVAFQSESMSPLSWGRSTVRLMVTFLLAIAGGELGRRRNLAGARDAGRGDAMA